MIPEIKQSLINRERWLKEKAKNKITWFKLHPVIRE